MPVTAQQFKILERIHKDMQQQFRWTSDLKVWGKREHWTRPMHKGGFLVGDCEDDAIEKWHRAYAMGIEATDVKLCGCFVLNANPEHPTPVNDEDMNHIVLAIKTKNGVFISDCNSKFIRPLADLPYLNWCWPEGAINQKWVKIKQA